MNEVERLAREAFGGLMDSFPRAELIPPRVGIRIFDEPFTQMVTFYVDVGHDRVRGFRLPMSETEEFGRPRNLYGWLRELWRDMRRERCEPPRMIAPPSMENLNEQMMRPGWVDFAAFPPEALYGGPAGGGVTSNAMQARNTLTVDDIRRSVEMLRQAEDARRIDRRRQWEMDYIEQDRQFVRERLCGCASCRRLREPDYVAAESRSIALLKEWLSPDQLTQYERENYFEVTGSKGTRYRIHHGRMGNVIEMEGSCAVRGWCFGPEGDPGRLAGDTMLAQKLALETDEEAAIAVANIVAGQPRPTSEVPAPPRLPPRSIAPFPWSAMPF